jgi:hypothetical protein
MINLIGKILVVDKIPAAVKTLVVDKIAAAKRTLLEFLEGRHRTTKSLRFFLWTWLIKSRACIVCWTSSSNPGAMAAVVNILRCTSSTYELILF